MIYLFFLELCHKKKIVGILLKNRIKCRHFLEFIFPLGEKSMMAAPGAFVFYRNRQVGDSVVVLLDDCSDIYFRRILS